MKAPPGGTSQYHYPIQRFVQRNMGAPDGAGDPRPQGFQGPNMELPMPLFPGTGVFAGPQGTPYIPPRPMRS